MLISRISVRVIGMLDSIITASTTHTRVNTRLLAQKSTDYPVLQRKPKKRERYQVLSIKK